MKYIKILLIILSLTAFISCDKVEDVDPGGTTTKEMAGDWWIIGLYDDGETPAYGGDYERFSTYNTSANDDSMWIDDYGTFFEIKTIISANLDDSTFENAVDTENLYGGTVKISNGKISKDNYTTSSKTIVDEIYFEAEFDWDPGYIYVFKGHKRTGHIEDEYPHY